MFGSFTSRLVRARAFVDADLDRIIILGVVLDKWHVERLGNDGEIRLGLTGWHCHRGMIKLTCNRFVVMCAENGHSHRHVKAARASGGSEQHFARNTNFDRELIAI